MLSTIFSAALLIAPLASAHLAPFHPSMWCFDGLAGDDINAYEAVNPIYSLGYSSYWMHANTGCLDHPPADGKFLELPAGGSFTVEIASNRAMTSWSYNGANAGKWPDGEDHDDYDSDRTECITVPNLHAENRSMAAGTVFAISYTSDINAVNEDNLVVFTVAPNTPWYRLTDYDVPADMPACPDGGCICAWGWVPNHCGIPNMYMHPYRCKVTGATGTTAVGTPKSPVWCENDPDSCVSGPKKFTIMGQNEGNTIELSGYQANGQEKSPGYNNKLGFWPGAQNDIFTGGSTSGGSDESGDSKDSEDSEDSEDSDDSEDSEDSEEVDSEDSEEVDSEDSEDSVDSEDSSEPSDSEDSEEPENTDDSEDSADSPDTADTPDSPDSSDSPDISSSSTKIKTEQSITISASTTSSTTALNSLTCTSRRRRRRRSLRAETLARAIHAHRRNGDSSF